MTGGGCAGLVDDPTGALDDGCLAVRPPGREVCQVCCGALEARPPLCGSCKRITRALGEPLRPVTPISLTTQDASLYAALRQYKGRSNSITDRQQLRLSRLVGEFLASHSRCVAPSGFDVVTVVPSSLVTSQAHPLVRILEMVGTVDEVEELLTTVAGRIARNVPDPGAYRCPAERVMGRRVLLMDDTYTTGAHLHSAASALAEAGASDVHLLVIGRYQDPAWPPARRLLEWSSSLANAWSASVCVRCRERDRGAAKSSPEGRLADRDPDGESSRDPPAPQEEAR
jgi:hypothetical protein